MVDFQHAISSVAEERRCPFTISSICIPMLSFKVPSIHAEFQQQHVLMRGLYWISLTGNSDFNTRLNATSENPTLIRLSQAHAGCRSGQLVSLYLSLVLCRAPSLLSS